MKKYLGIKLIEADQMTADEYIEYLKVNRPEGVYHYSGEDRRGYLIKYENGYFSWEPKEVFEKVYRPLNDMTFGLAVEVLKQGLKVARTGWNGNGMWLILVLTPPTTSFVIDDKYYGFRPYIQMKTADDELVPWVASQTDVLAEDWMIVE